MMTHSTTPHAPLHPPANPRQKKSSTLATIKMKFITFVSPLLLLLKTAHAFSSSLHPAKRISAWQSTGSCQLPQWQYSTVLFSSPVDEAEATTDSSDSEESSTEAAVVAAKVEPVEESKPYPIDLPSPLLLSASMVLAIASTGSLFELTGGAPTLGFGPQAALAAIGLPSSLFLIYAAILKGAAETEEDDKQYNKPKSGW